MQILLFLRCFVPLLLMGKHEMRSRTARREEVRDVVVSGGFSSRWSHFGRRWELSTSHMRCHHGSKAQRRPLRRIPRRGEGLEWAAFISALASPTQSTTRSVLRCPQHVGASCTLPSCAHGHPCTDDHHPQLNILRIPCAVPHSWPFPCWAQTPMLSPQVMTISYRQTSPGAPVL